MPFYKKEQIIFEKNDEKFKNISKNACNISLKII